MDPSSPAPPEDATALVVVVPEAEAAIGAIRAVHDPSSVTGMPAHVTVLYPFISESEWRYSGGDTRPDERLARLFRRFDPFDARFARTARFGDTTIYLVPEPAAAFADLLGAVAAEFPAWPPYGGVHAHVIPHMTIADQVTRDALDRCDAAVSGALPFTTRVTEVALFGRRDGRWTRFKAWPLGAAERAPVIDLRGDGDGFVRLSIQRYQFGVSDAASADWLVARVRVAAGDEESDLEGPNLEAHDLSRLADFFDAAASGSSGNLSCTFTEPCLSFVRSADVGGGATVRLRAGFAVDWALPWREPTDPHPAYGMPCSWVDLDLRPEVLRAAAAASRELARLWPSRAHLFPRPASAKALRKARRRNARRPPGPSAAPS